MEFIIGTPETTVTLNNRGLNYGDGIFTTIAICRSEIALMPLHQQRLLRGLSVLGMEAPNWESFWQFAQQVIASHNSSSLERTPTQSSSSIKHRHVLKILIVRGSGGRGYSTQGCSEQQAFFSLNGFPEHYDHWREQGVRVNISNVILGHNPMLAGIKHCNRIEQVLARQALDDDADSDDHLLCDLNNHLIEASAGNFFMLKDGHWMTPDLRFAGVDGVMRQWLLTHGFSPNEVTVADNICVEQLLSADSVFICNSLMGIVPVSQCGDQCYDTAPVLALSEMVRQHSPSVFF